MKERSKSIPACEVDPDPWNLEGISRALGVPAMPEQHPQLGAGVTFRFPQPAGPEAVLKLYPKMFLARYRSGLLALDVSHVHTLRASSGMLALHAADASHRAGLLLHPTDGLGLTIAPADAPINPELVPQPADHPNLDSPDRPESDQPETQDEQPGAERPTRVTLTGRLGRNPHLRTTKGGKLVAETALAVHRGEATDWHTVLFFDELATEAKQTLAKGQLVTIVGYRHEREARTRGGGVRTKAEIYAASVPTPAR